MPREKIMPTLKDSHTHLVQGKNKITYDTRRYTIPGFGRVVVQRDESGTQCFDEQGNAIATPPLVTSWLSVQPMAAPTFN